MEKLGTFSLKGASGQKYKFIAHPLKTNFEAISAVYAVTKRYKNLEDGHDHNVIYIGQTNNISKEFESHQKGDCFMAYSANCVCIHEDDDEQSRLDKEKDILSKYSPACNK